MTIINDGFRSVIFNAGEQVVASDHNSTQRQLRMLVLEMLTLPGIGNLAGDPDGSTVGPLDPEQAFAGMAQVIPTDAAFAPYPGCGYARVTAVANQIGVIPGPVIQVISDSGAVASPTESTPTILTHWISQDEFLLTTAVGHATLPRIDVVEMKLELIDTDPTARVIVLDGSKASLDMSTLGGVVDTVIQARVPGAGGNSISISTVANGTGAGTLTQNGNQLTFHFEDGVTTIANFETAVAASYLVEVASAGTGAVTFADPDDVYVETHLAGGADRQITSNPTLNKSRRVRATFQIKQGTPASTPAYPTPTAGFAAFAAVLVPATHNAAHEIDSMRDMRFPLGGLQIVDVDYNQINPNASGTTWTTDHGNGKLDSGGSAGSVLALCPGGFCGRLLGVGVLGLKASGDNTVLLRHVEQGGSAMTLTTIADLTTQIGDVMDPDVKFAYATLTDLMDAAGDTAEIVGDRASSTRVGTPIWTSGYAIGPQLNSGQILGPPQFSTGLIDRIGIEIVSGGSGDLVQLVRFYVARGMG